MAVKGSTAKITVENKIREVFGADFIGSVDKKIYVWADDGGEKVQIALSLTCPKVPVNIGSGNNNGLDFDNMNLDTTPPEPFKTAEVTDEELANIRKMLKELNL